MALRLFPSVSAKALFLLVLRLRNNMMKRPLLNVCTCPCQLMRATPPRSGLVRTAVRYRSSLATPTTYTEAQPFASTEASASALPSASTSARILPSVAQQARTNARRATSSLPPIKVSSMSSLALFRLTLWPTGPAVDISWCRSSGFGSLGWLSSICV